MDNQFITKYPSFFKKQHKKRTKSKQSYRNRQATHGYTPISGNYTVYTSSNCIFPANFFIYIKKHYKGFLKKKKIKLYFRVKTNYILSSKNKNSRMGKGVGTINRYSIAKKSNRVFFEIFNINLYRLRALLGNWHKRHNIRYVIIRR
jgi:ribosomal protein L16/L10AE